MLSSCDLHIHLNGAFYAEDVLDAGLTIFRDVDWQFQSFLSSYRATLNPHFDPIRLFEAAQHNRTQGLEQVKATYIFSEEDDSDFMHFLWKFRFFTRIWGALWELPRPAAAVSLVNQALDQFKRQGLRYVELRSGFWGSLDVTVTRIQLCIETLQAASNSEFSAKYILPVRREVSAEDNWQIINTLLARSPHLTSTLVGIDFASIEENSPPKLQQPFFQKLHQFNAENPHHRLDVVYHVGESFYDKTLESAVRWCHEAALLGAKRLGHCIALGLHPAVAIARRPQAHQAELISERLDQIAYDLRYFKQLTAYGIDLNLSALRAEEAVLKKRDKNDRVGQPYTPQRLQNARKRQQFVLDQLVARGTVIESCPTSNLRIGGVPNAKQHPIHAFLRSQVNLVICTDDPGVFDITLASEVAWVVENSDFSRAALEKRLGDPYRFRLGQR